MVPFSKFEKIQIFKTFLTIPFCQEILPGGTDRVREG